MKIKKRPELLKSASGFVVRAVFRVSVTIFLFIIINMIFFLYALSALSEFSIVWKLTVILLGVIFAVFACVITYRAILVDGIEQIYDQTTVIWQKLCRSIVSKMNTGTNAVSKSIDAGDMIEGLYDSNVPGFLKRGMKVVLSFVPIVSMALEMKEIIKTTDQEVSANMLYNRVDKHIKEEVFASNMHIYIGGIAVVNIIVQIAYILIVS